MRYTPLFEPRTKIDPIFVISSPNALFTGRIEKRRAALGYTGLHMCMEVIYMFDAEIGGWLRSRWLSPAQMRVPPVPSIWGPGMEAPLHPNLPIGVFSKSMKGQRVRYQQTEDFHSPGLQQFPASAIPVDGGGEGAF